MTGTQSPRRPPQFYGGTGVPMYLDRDPAAPANAWRAHRARLRAWLAALTDDEWSGPTRCELWDVSKLVQHLASGSQFLGYTLHKAGRGTATTLLTDFDPHGMVQERAAMLGDMRTQEALDTLASMDASVDAQLKTIAEVGWSSMAEAPLGHFAAHLSVNHFLFDSWVHEYDLMLPLHQNPVIETPEVEAVVAYLLALATVATGSTTSLDVRLTEPDLRIGLAVVNDVARVAVGSVPDGAAVVEGTAQAVVDRTTGRRGGPVRGDERALAVLDEFGELLSG